jgi:hypothetical protein
VNSVVFRLRRAVERQNAKLGGQLVAHSGVWIFVHKDRNSIDGGQLTSPQSMTIRNWTRRASRFSFERIWLKTVQAFRLGKLRMGLKSDHG